MLLGSKAKGVRAVPVTRERSRISRLPWHLCAHRQPSPPPAKRASDHHGQALTAPDLPSYTQLYINTFNS